MWRILSVHCGCFITTLISPQCTVEIPQCNEHLQCNQDILHCSEHPQCTHDTPTQVMILLLCINETLPIAMYNPQCNDNIPQCTEHWTLLTHCTTPNPLHTRYVGWFFSFPADLLWEKTFRNTAFNNQPGYIVTVNLHWKNHLLTDYLMSIQFRWSNLNWTYKCDV